MVNNNHMRPFYVLIKERTEVGATVDAPDLDTALAIVEEQWNRGAYDYGDIFVEVFDENGNYLTSL